MLSAGGVRIYLVCGSTDTRTGFHSLAAQVQLSLQRDPLDGLAR
jgi:IS66 Orf2 like protein